MYLFYWKGRYIERRRDREEDLPSDASLPKQPQWLELSQFESRSLFWVSCAGAGSQSFGLSSTAFPGHKQGAGWEVEPLGLKQATGIKTHMGSQHVQDEDFNHYAITPDPILIKSHHQIIH